MLRNFKHWLAGLAFNAGAKWDFRDPRVAVRLVLGVLLLANLIAAYFVFRTPGGSAEELAQQAVTLQAEIGQRRTDLARMKANALKVAKAREAGDDFLQGHFLGRRNAYSTLVIELESAAKAAGVKAREQAFNFEPIEGSDTIGLLTVNAGYEGTYADLIEFVNRIDRAKKMLIIMETLQAQPQQGSQTLLITMKMITFVREDGSDVPLPVANPAANPAGRT